MWKYAKTCANSGIDAKILEKKTYRSVWWWSQQTWFGFSPTTVPDNNRQSGFSPTTVPKLSTGIMLFACFHFRNLFRLQENLWREYSVWNQVLSLVIYGLKNEATSLQIIFHLESSWKTKAIAKFHQSMSPFHRYGICIILKMIQLLSFKLIMTLTLVFLILSDISDRSALNEQVDIHLWGQYIQFLQSKATLWNLGFIGFNLVSTKVELRCNWVQAHGWTKICELRLRWGWVEPKLTLSSSVSFNLVPLGSFALQELYCARGVRCAKSRDFLPALDFNITIVNTQLSVTLLIKPYLSDFCHIWNQNCHKNRLDFPYIMKPHHIINEHSLKYHIWALHHVGHLDWQFPLVYYKAVLVLLWQDICRGYHAILMQNSVCEDSEVSRSRLPIRLHCQS